MSESSNPPRRFGARPRGFAGLDPARLREISREGGRAAHEKGTAHQFSPEEARAAGLKGRMNRRAVGESLRP